jgi:hypothetical protein
VEALALADVVAVAELLVPEDVAVGMDDALREAGRARGVVQLRRLVGERVDGLDDSRIAPSFQVAKNNAAVSGVGASTTATRSPRSTPIPARTFANWQAMSWSSPQRTSRTAPEKCSCTIASRSRGCLSHTSAAMLKRSGTRHSWSATARS